MDVDNLKPLVLVISNNDFTNVGFSYGSREIFVVRPLSDSGRSPKIMQHNSPELTIVQSSYSEKSKSRNARQPTDSFIHFHDPSR